MTTEKQCGGYCRQFCSCDTASAKRSSDRTIKSQNRNFEIIIKEYADDIDWFVSWNSAMMWRETVVWEELRASNCLLHLLSAESQDKREYFRMKRRS